MKDSNTLVMTVKDSLLCLNLPHMVNGIKHESVVTKNRVTKQMCGENKMKEPLRLCCHGHALNFLMHARSQKMLWSTSMN